MNSASVLVDNDVILKLCAYQRHSVLMTGPRWGPARSLAVARFVLRDLVRRHRKIRDREAVARALEETMAALSTVEPDAAAIDLAAELEEEAMTKALELDPGESLLLAIAILEGTSILLTGDKRAIAAIESLEREEVARQIASLEHVLADLLAKEGHASLGMAICREPDIDRTAAICFGCATGGADGDHIDAALASYIGSLRKSAPRCLIS